MFYQVFLLPQVKRCANITYKHGIYDVPNELSNSLNLGSEKIGNMEISGKCLNPIEW